MLDVFNSLNLSFSSQPKEDFQSALAISREKLWHGFLVINNTKLFPAHWLKILFAKIKDCFGCHQHDQKPFSLAINFLKQTNKPSRGRHPVIIKCFPINAFIKHINLLSAKKKNKEKYKKLFSIYRKSASPVNLFSLPYFNSFERNPLKDLMERPALLQFHNSFKRERSTDSENSKKDVFDQKVRKFRHLSLKNMFLKPAWETIRLIGFGVLLGSGVFILESIKERDSISFVPPLRQPLLSPARIDPLLSLGTIGMVSALMSGALFMFSKNPIKQWKKVEGATPEARKRRRVVLPRQLIPLFDKFLVDRINVSALAQGLCREINEMALDPETYRGRSIRLNNLYKIYRFPIMEKDTAGKTEKIKLSLNCWIEMPQDLRFIKVAIIPENEPVIGQGRYKITSKAQTFIIPIKLRNFNTKPKEKVKEKKQEIRYVERVNHRIKGERPEELKNLKKIVFEGLKVQEEILKLIDEQAQKENLPKNPPRIAKLPKSRLPLIHSTDEYVFDLEQKWYNSDLNTAIQTSSVPLDFKDSQRAITLLDKLQVIIDIAYTLQFIHEKGYVHRDVKPANILIKLEGKEVAGYLSDFDFACGVGVNKIKAADYRYWDKMSKKGMVTPFADIFGLGMTLGELIIPHFFDYIEKEPKVFFDKSKRENLLLIVIKQFLNKSPFPTLASECLKESKEKIFEKISSEICHGQNSSNSISKKNLIELYNRLQAIDKTYQFIVKLLETNRDFYQEYVYNEKCLNLNRDLRGNAGEINSAIDRLKKEFPLFKIEELIHVCLEIQKILRFNFEEGR